jgi:hypothetical protein
MRLIYNHHLLDARGERDRGTLNLYCDMRALARVKYLCMHSLARGVCVLCVATINIKRCGEIGPLCDRSERCNSIPLSLSLCS